MLNWEMSANEMESCETRTAFTYLRKGVECDKNIYMSSLGYLPRLGKFYDKALDLTRGIVNIGSFLKNETLNF